MQLSRAVADHFHLELLPAEHAFPPPVLSSTGDAARPEDTISRYSSTLKAMPPPVPPSVKEGADDGWQAQLFENGFGFDEGVDGARFRAFKADLVHRVAEALAVFRLVDDIGLRADHLHAEQFQHAALFPAPARS